MLKVTKYGHSCVLVETPDRVGLFDPGGWANYVVNELPTIDRIVYTHEHGDHFDIDKLKELVSAFPNAQVVANDAIKKLILDAGIEVTVREETQCTTKFEAPHESLPIPGVEPPAENGYHFQGVFSHSGDSYRFVQPNDVLAVGLVGPWGSLKDGIAAILALDKKPRYILPIHDWHFSKEGRDWNYTMAQNVFSDQGITVLSSDSGVTHEFDEQLKLIES